MITRSQYSRWVRGVVSRIAIAIIHLYTTLVSDEPHDAFAVISRFVRLQVEMIVLFSKRGYALRARRSVFAVEGWDLGTRRGFAVDALGGNDEEGVAVIVVGGSRGYKEDDDGGGE